MEIRLLEQKETHQADLRDVMKAKNEEIVQLQAKVLKLNKDVEEFELQYDNEKESHETEISGIMARLNASKDKVRLLEQCIDKISAEKDELESAHASTREYSEALENHFKQCKGFTERQKQTNGGTETEGENRSDVQLSKENITEEIRIHIEDLEEFFKTAQEKFVRVANLEAEMEVKVAQVRDLEAVVTKHKTFTHQLESLTDATAEQVATLEKEVKEKDGEITLN